MAFLKSTTSNTTALDEDKEDEVVLGGSSTTLGGTGGSEDVSTDVGMGQASEAATGGQNVSEQESYLEANKQKALALAGEAGDVIRGDISTANTGMTEAERQYKEAVAAGTVGLNQDFYGSASSALVDQTAPDWSQSGLDEFMAGNYQDATVADDYNAWAQSMGYATATPAPVAEENPFPDAIPGATNPMQPTATTSANPTPEEIAAMQQKMQDEGILTANEGGVNEYQADYDAYLNEFTPQDAITNQEMFQQQYGAAYGGPKDIYSQDYWGQTQRDYEKAQQTRELMNTLEGRQNLVARTYGEGSGRYSRGTTALDEALLSGSDEAMNELALAGDEGLGLEAQLAAMEGMSQEEYLAAKAATDKTRGAYADQFNLTNEEQEIRDKTVGIKDQAKTDYEDYLKYIQDTYGVQEGIAASSYFDTPQDYLNVQAQNVMSTEDVARMKALESLTDSVGTLTPFEGQAGQYTEYIDPSADFRKDDFGAQVGTARDARIKAEIAEQKRLQAVIDAQESAEAAAAEAEAKAQATAIGAAVGATAGAIVGSIVPGIGTAAGAVVGGAIGSVVGSLFCFDGSSEFEMADGTYKMIKDIEIGDVLKEGGKVYSVSKHILSSQLYSYPTGDESTYIWVTGNHAVKENGAWVRISDSIKGSLVYEHDIEFTYSLSCEHHIMMSHGITFADYAEVENDQGLTDIQCLNVLNGGSECMQLM